MQPLIGQMISESCTFWPQTEFAAKDGLKVLVFLTCKALRYVMADFSGCTDRHTETTSTRASGPADKTEPQEKGTARVRDVPTRSVLNKRLLTFSVTDETEIYN